MNRLLQTLLLALACAAFSSSGAPPEIHPLPWLSPTNLLVYLDRHEKPQPVGTVRDWRKRRAEILANMQRVMGLLPGKEKRCPLDVKIEEETDCGDYVRRRLTYAAEPGSRAPAYLLIPKSALAGDNKFPAVLCLHGTEMNLGYKTEVGLGHGPYRAYAVDLVERGYVTLSPSYPLMANYQPDLNVLGYKSGTMKAIWDNIRGLDLLDSLPFVKKSNYGALGHSLGGHNSIFTAVFDDRIKIVVSSCGFDSFRDYHGGDIKGWTSARYMPRLLDYPPGRTPFDFHELLAALAPRACFINAPLSDSNFQSHSVDEIVRAASDIYKLYRVPENLRVEHPEGGHDFPEQARQDAYTLLDKTLK